MAYGKTIGKILELLASGLVLGFVRDKSARRKLLEECDKVWHTIDRKQLNQIIKKFGMAGLIRVVERSGTEKVFLTDAGRNKFLRYHFHHMKLSKPRRWDKKWRLVLFDVPEQKRRIRDALRRKLKELGFLEFQKSVFIVPYPCEDEINFIINFFDIAEFVFYLEAPLKSDTLFRAHFKV